eukprot:SAG22_NODE_1626_length_3956_cov_2.706767_2_plen_82_part_00
MEARSSEGSALLTSVICWMAAACRLSAAACSSTFSSNSSSSTVRLLDVSRSPYFKDETCSGQVRLVSLVEPSLGSYMYLWW